MKKVLLPVTLFAFLSFFGCNESDSKLDQHLCQAFYDTVGQPGKQIALDLSTKPELTEEHKTYALSVSLTGSFTITPKRTGTLVIATSNAEPSFALSVNGVEENPLSASGCDIRLYRWSFTAESTIEIKIDTDEDRVLLAYSIED